MDEAAARRLLGVGVGATRQEIEAAFRAEARRTHPDGGGRPDLFRSTVEARTVLLAPRRPPPVTVVADVPVVRQVIVAVLRRLFDRDDKRPPPRVR